MKNENERIKELEDCCWEELGEEGGMYPVFNTKKFAELIVKQCVLVVKEHYDDTLPWGGVGNVLEHFGVEE